MDATCFGKDLDHLAIRAQQNATPAAAAVHTEPVTGERPQVTIMFTDLCEHAFPPGVETQGNVEEVLRLIARAILGLHKQPVYLGFLRMVVADARQFPWIAEEFAAVMDPLTERLARYLDHLTAMGILDCRNPTLSAHQFMGLLNEFSLWPWMMGRDSVPVPDEDVVEATVRMFLQSYGRPRPKGDVWLTRTSSPKR
jgi:hypothetical protein